MEGKCLPCPTCYAAVSRRTTSEKGSHPYRDFYGCWGPLDDQHLFKWADQVKPEELIDVPPVCRGCGAGPCRVRRFATGPDAGRILFMCRVKEGEGCCGYKVWKDELETIHQDETITSSYSTPFKSDLTSSANTALEEQSAQNNKGADNKVMPVDSSQHSPNLQATPPEMENPNFQSDKRGEYSRRSLNRSRYGDSKDGSPPLDSHIIVEDKTLENYGASITLPRSFQGVENCRKSLFTRTHDAKLSGTKHFRDDRSCGAQFGDIITKPISMAFGKAAENLQNDLVTLLEDAEDQNAMSKSAEATFTAPNHLFIDHQYLKERVQQLIRCAMSMADNEQFIPRNDTYQKLVDQVSSKKMRVEKINRDHAEIFGSVTEKKQHVAVLEEEIASAKDRLFHMESELSCCKVEMGGMVHKLEQISRDKEIEEEEYQNALKELESHKIHEQREA